MDDSETIAGVATAYVEAEGVVRADRQLGRGAAIAEALVGQLLRATPDAPPSGRWTVDKIQPDMLGERALIPAHYDAGRKLGLGSTQPEEISSNDPTTTSTAVNALHGTVQIWMSKQWKSNLGVPAAESMT